MLTAALIALAATVVTPKILCDGYELAPLTRGVACSEKETHVRARQQCMELLEFSVAEKRARIDQAAAKRCLDARKAHQADRRLPRALGDAARAACAQAVVGRQAAGQPCETAWECAAGLACIRGAAPSGKCAKPIAGAAACSDDLANDSGLHALYAALRSPCGDGRVCAPPVTGGGAAAAAVCQARGNAGAACAAAAGVDTCAAGLRCAAGRCVDETRGKAGDACAKGADCADGDWCSGGKCVAGREVGAACSESAECRGDCTGGKCADVCR